MNGFAVLIRDKEVSDDDSSKFGRIDRYLYAFKNI